MKVKIETREKSTDETNTIYNIRYNITLSADEATLARTQGADAFCNNTFSIDGLTGSYRLTLNANCPLSTYALLKEMKFACKSDESGYSVWTADTKYVSWPEYDSSRTPDARFLDNSFTVKRTEEVADMAWDDSKPNQTEPSIPIRTTAGEPFTNPPVMVGVNEVELAMEIPYKSAFERGGANGSAFDVSIFTGALDCVNKIDVTLCGFVFKPKQLRVDSIQPKINYYIRLDGNTKVPSAYVSCIFKFTAKTAGRTHDRRLPNLGYIALDPTTKKPYRIPAADGSSAIQSPAKLTKDGYVAAKTDDPIILSFRTNRYFDFNLFGIPKQMAPNVDSVLFKTAIGG